MSDYLTPADIESILNDSRWAWAADDQVAQARSVALPRTPAHTACHEINFKGGRNWMTDERPGATAWWRFWK